MSSLYISGDEPKTAPEYLELIGDWEDPNPDILIMEHEGFKVVRDDLLMAHTNHKAIAVGTKVRSVDYIIGHDPNYSHINDWVFGSCPATGYAQKSLPYVCHRYRKRCSLFMAQRKVTNLHQYQLEGLDLGGPLMYHWVPNGMLNVTQARAREYAAEQDDREVLPLGLEHPTVIASIIRIARRLPIMAPKEVWTVGSSGTLNRGLQLAWPDAEVHVVSVGHKMSERDIGRAIYHRSDLKFDKPVKAEDAPPFPSAPTYDAKAWKFMRELASPGSLFWNVGA